MKLFDLDKIWFKSIQLFPHCNWVSIPAPLSRAFLRIPFSKFRVSLCTFHVGFQPWNRVEPRFDVKFSQHSFHSIHQTSHFGGEKMLSSLNVDNARWLTNQISSKSLTPWRHVLWRWRRARNVFSCSSHSSQEKWEK